MSQYLNVGACVRQHLDGHQCPAKCGHGRVGWWNVVSSCQRIHRTRTSTVPNRCLTLKTNKKPTNWSGQAKRCDTHVEILCRHYVSLVGDFALNGDRFIRLLPARGILRTSLQYSVYFAADWKQLTTSYPVNLLHCSSKIMVWNVVVLAAPFSRNSTNRHQRRYFRPLFHDNSRSEVAGGIITVRS